MAHTRQQQKAQTRQALLDTTLHLMEHQSLSSLGLREITRAVGIVPGAFYRHFPDVESLGVALVEQCLGGLRSAVRSVRDGMAGSDEVIDRSVDVLLRQLDAHRDEFRFIARERYGGLRRVRDAIREQLALFAEELATDLVTNRLVHSPELDGWPAHDVRMLADLIVNHMVWTGAALLEVPADDPARAAAITQRALRQLQLILLGARQWPAATAG